MRTEVVISLALPSEMERELQRVAKAERRSISEIMLEAIRQYSTSRDLGAIRREGRKIAKRKKLRPNDVTSIVRLGRR